MLSSETPAQTNFAQVDVCLHCSELHSTLHGAIITERGERPDRQALAAFIQAPHHGYFMNARVLILKTARMMINVRSLISYSDGETHMSIPPVLFPKPPTPILVVVAKN
jgi:hypothetical protein